jgi:trans-aconitate 2-methyltransferase
MGAHVETDGANSRLIHEHRIRSAVDLLNRIPDSKPRRIADLGCGPGYATALLARRFGDAEIVGVDDSGEMLEQAKARLPNIQFDQSDIGRWNPTEPFDLIFSNLTLQNWPRLRPFLPRLLSLLEDGGRLAVQLPNNLHEPNRVLVRMLAADGPWAKQLLPIAKSRPFNETVEGLYSRLIPRCASLEIWETTYIYPLDGVTAVMEWMKATSLEPFLRPLEGAARQNFLARCAAELANAYPVQPDGKVLVHYPRMFILAQR